MLLAQEEGSYVDIDESVLGSTESLDDDQNSEVVIDEVEEEGPKADTGSPEPKLLLGAGRQSTSNARHHAAKLYNSRLASAVGLNISIQVSTLGQTDGFEIASPKSVIALEHDGSCLHASTCGSHWSMKESCVRPPGGDLA